MTLALDFEGWFQCRLATDPDPSDEPRGVSGWTFAVAGEPDLDRIIRLQPEGTVPRLGGPLVGVKVTRVTVGGSVTEGHALIEARVVLRGTPRFEGRNHLEADDGFEPIRPFDISVERSDVALARRARTNGLWGTPNALGQEMHAIPRDLAVRLGVADPKAARAARRDLLARHLGDPEISPTERAALAKRVAELDKPNATAETLMGIALPYRFDLTEAAEVSDPNRVIGAAVDLRAPWPIAFWCGAWDADALCGFMSGRLTVATRI